MQLLLGLFLIVTTACALAQQYSTPSSAPALPDAVQRPSPASPRSEATSSGTGTNLPDAPSSLTQQPSSDASTSQPTPVAGVIPNSRVIGWGTISLASTPRQFFNLANPNNIGNSSLIFVGGASTTTEAHDTRQQPDGGATGSAKNCSSGSGDKTDGSSWITSLLSIASKGPGYCALGEGGFWKRGTYAWTRAFAAHRNDGANSSTASGLFAPNLATGPPSAYSAYQGYANQYNAGERLATRYATAVGRDALKNMFREFWPDVSSRLQHRHP